MQPPPMLPPLWRHRELITHLVRRNVLLRYQGSALGLVWMFGTPLLMLAVYTFVFSVVFKARWGTGEEQLPPGAFALTLMCGLSVYNIVAETLNASAICITANPNYVKKVVFPLEVLPVAALLTSLFFAAIWFGLLIVGIVAVMHVVSPAMLTLPLLLIPVVLLTCGLAWVVASLGVYIPDVSHALGIILQVLFFLTPIFYSVEMIPERFRQLVYLNPLTYAVESVRGVLIAGQWPDWIGLGVFTAIAAGVFFAGYAWFIRTKKGFADVL